MKIKINVIETINKAVLDIPPETGGILGSHDGKSIDEVVLDTNKFPITRKCSYSPDIDFFNKVIEEWQINKISFMGIFHTHFFGVDTLSYGDMDYINTIMMAMPNDVKFLYFPIFVLPERRFTCYKAVCEEGKIKVHKDDVIIE